MTRSTNSNDNQVKRPENREWIVATENDAIVVGYDYIVQNLNSVSIMVVIYHLYRTGQNYVDITDFQDLEFNGEKVLEIQWSN